MIRTHGPSWVPRTATAGSRPCRIALDWATSRTTSFHSAVRGTRRRTAFTLIELIATMVILSVLGTFASNILLTGADGYLQSSTTSQLHHELSVGLDRIVREIRRIDLDTAASGIAPHIDDITSTSLDWRDADGDAYRLSQDGSSLMLAVNGGADHRLLTDVSSFSLQAYDDDNAALAANLAGVACDPVRRIEISITLQRFGTSETLGAKVFLRSTMSGL